MADDDERKLMANITPFGLRMQPELKARVEEAAKANNRSMNAEIVARLEETFEHKTFEQVRALNDLVVSLDKVIETTEASRKASVAALTHELEGTREALREQRGVTSMMQQLINEAAGRSHEDGEQSRETLETIQSRYDEMVEQRTLLEGLKEELQQLLADRGDEAPQRDAIMKEQSDLIEKMGRDLRQSGKLIMAFRDAFLDAASGDDTELKKIIADFDNRQPKE